MERIGCCNAMNHNLAQQNLASVMISLGFKMPLMMAVAVLLPIRTVRREDREVPTPLSRAARKRGHRNLVRILAAPNLVIT